MIGAPLMALHVLGHPRAVPMPLALVIVQICYNLAMIWAVGWASPVVKPNLPIVPIQIIAITATLLFA